MHTANNLAGDVTNRRKDPWPPAAELPMVGTLVFIDFDIIVVIRFKSVVGMLIIVIKLPHFRWRVAVDDLFFSFGLLGYEYCELLVG